MMSSFGTKSQNVSIRCLCASVICVYSSFKFEGKKFIRKGFPGKKIHFENFLRSPPQIINGRSISRCIPFLAETNVTRSDMTEGVEQMLNNDDDIVAIYFVRHTDIINHFSLHIPGEDNKQQKSYIVLAMGAKSQISTCGMMSMFYTVRPNTCGTIYDQCKMMNEMPAPYYDSDEGKVTCMFNCSCSGVGNQCTIHARTFYKKVSTGFHLLRIAVQRYGLNF